MDAVALRTRGSVPGCPIRAVPNGTSHRYSKGLPSSQHTPLTAHSDVGFAKLRKDDLNRGFVWDTKPSTITPLVRWEVANRVRIQLINVTLSMESKR